MSLTNKLSTGIALVGIGIGNVFFNSGCATVEREIAHNQAVWAQKRADREARLASGQQGGIGQILHDSGNPIEAVINSGVYILGGNAGETRQPVANNNLNTAALVEAYARMPVDMMFPSSGAQDKNNNGLLEFPQEFMNVGKRSFTTNEIIFLNLYRRNSEGPKVIKYRISNMNNLDDIYDSGYHIVAPNAANQYVFKSTPGVYRAEFIDDANNKIGEFLFEVTEAK